MNKRIDELVQVWIDGELAPAELAELSAALSDPTFQTAAAGLVRDHQLLRCASRGAAASGVERVAALIDQRQRGGVGSQRVRNIRQCTATDRHPARGRHQAGRRQSWWPMAVAALLLVAVGIFISIPREPARLGVIEESSGNLGRIVYVGEILSTQDDPLVVRLDQGHRLRLDGHGEVKLPELIGQAFLLRRGVLHAETTAGAAAEGFIVITSEADAVVLGTRFTISSNDGISRITVLEGRVHFTRHRDGSSVELAAGGQADTTDTTDTANAAVTLVKPSATVAYRWKPVLVSEFGQGRLDPRLDFIQGDRKAGGLNELQTYRADAHEFRDGGFALRAERQGLGPQATYTAGFLRCAGNLVQSFGRYELHGRFPRGVGVGVTIRLLSERSWPPEISVVYDGNHPDQVELNHHTNEISSKLQKTARCPDLSVGDHDLTLVWDPEQITWLVDGHELASTPTTTTREPLFLVINLSVGGKHLGNPLPATAFPAYFLLKSLRIQALDK